MDLRGTYKGGGGPDKTILNSAARHDPEKVYVLVTYLRQPWDDEFQIPEMARRLGIRYVDVCDGGLIDWTCLRRLLALLREHRLTVVHAHDDKTLLYGWLLRFMHPDLKIMYTCHSHAMHTRGDFQRLSEYLGYRVRQRVQIFLMKRFLKPILTVSNDTKLRLVANGLISADVAVLYNGIDISRWRSRGVPVLRKELLVPPDGLVVGTVARITYEKDLDTFFAVAQEVVVRFPKVTFVIVGDGYGDELDRARDEVARRGIDSLVRFTGHRNDLVEIYSSFDVFLMTSLTEGLPNTLLEAMALGIPSVSTAVGGVPELLEDGSSGFLAPAGASSALAGHVIRLLESPSLRVEMGNAAREKVETNFDFFRRVRSTEDYYAWFAGVGPGPQQGPLPPERCHA